MACLASAVDWPGGMDTMAGVISDGFRSNLRQPLAAGATPRCASLLRSETKNGALFSFKLIGEVLRILHC